MSFIADKQTLDDLGLLGKYNTSSIFSLFNQVHTRGGEKLLDAMFQHPFTDADKINSRSAAFGYFRDHPAVFPFDEQLLSRLEAYLEEGSGGSLPLVFWQVSRKKLMEVAVKEDTYRLQLEGINTCIHVLKGCAGLLSQLEREGQDKGTPWENWAKAVQGIIKDKRLTEVLAEQGVVKRSLLQVARLHYLFVHVFHNVLKNVLELTYEIDVYLTVSGIAREKNFSYATALPQLKNTLVAKGLRHPRVEKAVPNAIAFNGASNVLFLTGANMAGKSTLMKATGIMLYLAHMGFPVAADELQFSVLDGIYSSVNVPDDLNRGYSHFYAEVLRVKKVAEEVDAEKHLFVIFDELFKGTNVKDAYDATLAVTGAFTAFSDCFFIISTHIFEVGEELKAQGDRIQFEFLPTVMEGAVPRYTYTLQKGITEDRQGMIIIENEGILDML
ncbi:DNA mismatch repair protein [Chitinophaga sp. SYP-B3965]|uniref:MutS-related protein n=1 Tax=Chitinophaga sp. SYP-B3965 TaxID=2663120 RepID=UPI0012997F7B|nr:DNA mismatch repair protein [Chitinophaga sp. SYP-B3965]MRG43585.1 DNA mismatch repair protein [Chitinophaga sp. SYP-B3965]